MHAVLCGIFRKIAVIFNVLQCFSFHFSVLLCFAMLFILNTLSFCIVLKSVEIRKLFCTFQKRLYLCGVFKRDTRETRHTAAHGSGSRSDETADRARQIDRLRMLIKCVRPHVLRQTHAPNVVYCIVIVPLVGGIHIAPVVH